MNYEASHLTGDAAFLLVAVVPPPGQLHLCALAYYVEWRMKWRQDPMLSGENGDGEHSFRTLLSDWATLTKNTVWVGEHISFDQITRSTELQQRALDLLEVRPQL